MNIVKRHSKRRAVKWENSEFEEWKGMSATVKGDCGEEIICFHIKNLFENAEIINRGKGEFDILTESGLKIECKTATEDSNGAFQLNGIKKNIGYDYIFGLCVSPNELWFGIWSKKEMQELNVAMTKDGSDTFKLSARKSRKSSKSKYTVLPLTKENLLSQWSSKIV
jgi:hypothetical protein